MWKNRADVAIAFYSRINGKKRKTFRKLNYQDEPERKKGKSGERIVQLATAPASGEHKK